MAKFVTQCPSCQSALQATRLACTSAGCETHLDGQFEVPKLMQLAPADLAFVVEFVQSSGSLKAMAEQSGTSYPTVRNRLNDIIANLNALDQAALKRRHQILDQLETGKITVKVAEARLRKEGL
jgi:hypothetical protein